MNRVFILIGGNLGNRELNLSKSTKLLKKNSCTIVNESCLYETAPWGNSNQPNFLNQVIELETETEPYEFMELLLEIEYKLGRERSEKNAARTIDMDILFFNTEIIDTHKLSVPHPRMMERMFVLKPLAEIAGNFVHPVYNKTIKELLKNCTDKLSVKKFSSK